MAFNINSITDNIFTNKVAFSVAGSLLKSFFDGGNESLLAQNSKDSLISLGEDVYRYFNTQMFSQQISPDISGYTMICLVPPDLSGLPLKFFSSLYLENICKLSPFLALEFIPPESSMEYETLSSTALFSVPFATGKKTGGQLSINYIETSALSNFTLHSIWVEYINSVVFGTLEPDKKFITADDNGVFSPEFGQIDYMTSAYVIRYKPDMKFPVFIGKATGIFPISLPTKEIIGSRSENTLTILPINYACTDYSEVSIGPHAISDEYLWIVEDFVYDVYLRYFSLTSALKNLPNLFGDTLNAASGAISSVIG